MEAMMAENLFDRVAPHAFGTITHTVFVTVNGNEEYDMKQFTMTGFNPIQLMFNIAARSFREVSEVYDDIEVSDILIDVYHYESDDDGQYAVEVLRTNLDELMGFLWGLGMSGFAHNLEWLSIDIDNVFPEMPELADNRDAEIPDDCL
jgi:hypothetical protein